jgi:hypothetical protein
VASRDDLVDWVYAAVAARNGVASIVEVAKHIWEHHENDLRKSNDLFYIWQYEMRWAAQKLRHTGRFASVALPPGRMGHR